MKPFAVEKDWWVSRTLEIIFQMPCRTFGFQRRHITQQGLEIDQ
jgi:hypothetical protein